MKKLILSFALLLATVFGINQLSTVTTAQAETSENQFVATESCDRPNPNYCGNNSLTNGLESNETTLFYMYSDENGMYFLDPLAEVENIIFVGHDDHKILPALEIDTDNLYHGQRFVGAFADSDLWELVALIEIEYLDMEEN